MVVAAAADTAAAADKSVAAAVVVHYQNARTLNYQNSTNWVRKATWAILSAFASSLQRCHFHSVDYCTHGLLEDTVAEAGGGTAEALEVGGLT